MNEILLRNLDEKALDTIIDLIGINYEEMASRLNIETSYLKSRMPAGATPYQYATFLVKILSRSTSNITVQELYNAFIKSGLNNSAFKLEKLIRKIEPQAPQLFESINKDDIIDKLREENIQLQKELNKSSMALLSAQNKITELEKIIDRLNSSSFSLSSNLPSRSSMLDSLNSSNNRNDRLNPSSNSNLLSRSSMLNDLSSSNNSEKTQLIKTLKMGDVSPSNREKIAQAIAHDFMKIANSMIDPKNGNSYAYEANNNLPPGSSNLDKSRWLVENLYNRNLSVNRIVQAIQIYNYDIGKTIEDLFN